MACILFVDQTIQKGMFINKFPVCLRNIIVMVFLVNLILRVGASDDPSISELLKIIYELLCKHLYLLYRPTSRKFLTNLCFPLNIFYAL